MKGEKFKRPNGQFKPFYRPLAYSLLFIGTDIFASEQKECRVIRFLSRGLNHLINFHAVLTGIFALGCFLDGFGQNAISLLLFYYSGVALRLLLLYKRREIVNVLRVLSNFKMRIREDSFPKQKRKFCFLISSSVSALLIALCFALYILSVPDGEGLLFSHSSNWRQTLTKISPHGETIFGFGFIFEFYFCCFLPYCNCAYLLYCVSWHLREVMTVAEKRIVSSPFDFNSNQTIFRRVGNLVHLVDFKLRGIVQCASLHLTFTLYYIAFTVSKSNLNHYWYNLNSFCLLFTLYLVAMSVVHAGDIPTINERILTTINSLPFERNFLVERLAFIESLKQGPLLTLGGLIPVKKNTFFVVVGTFLTYSLLIRAYSES